MSSARAHLVEITRAATDPARTARHAATMARVAQDRLARLEHALAEIPDVAAIKKKSGAKDATPRVSTTDPDARVMKMPDGWLPPGLQRPTRHPPTTDAARAIVGVTNRGSDQGQAAHARTDRGPHRRPPHRAARRWWLPGTQAARQGV